MKLIALVVAALLTSLLAARALRLRAERDWSRQVHCGAVDVRRFNKRYA